MDPDVQLLLYGLGFALWLAAFFAIIRLFRIDKSLRTIGNEMSILRSIEVRRAMAEGNFSARKCGNCGMLTVPEFNRACPECGYNDWKEISSQEPAPTTIKTVISTDAQLQQALKGK